MTLPLLIAYAAVAVLVFLVSGWLVGLSPAGRAASGVVAVLWLPLLVLLAAIGTFAALEHRIDALINPYWPGADI